MRLKAVSGIMLTLLLIGMLTLAFNIQPAKAEPRTWTVDDDGPADFHTIQDAINVANEGDTIFVIAGTYYEHIVVNKPMSLIGENRSTTIIDGNGLLEIVNIVAHDVFLSGFTVRNGYRTIVVASQITLSRYNTIHGCVLRQASFGIILWGEIYADASGHSYMPSGLNVIEENIIETTYAIELGDSHNNKIADNIIENGAYGIYVDGYSHDNLITGNLLQNIRARGEAITLMGGNATIIGNTFKANDWGLFIYGGMPLTHHVHHNNFIANVRHVELLYGPSIVWDSGYPSGGNYWSDYTDLDQYNGPYQNETGSDGIWDHPYSIDENNQDNYPLIHLYGSIRNLDTNLTYLTIQSAIDAPETLDGHTILVDAGLYHECIVVNKSLSLIGEDRDSTIIDGNDFDSLVNVEANNVRITGFTLQGWSSAYIFMNGTTNVTINENRILFVSVGVYMVNSNNNVISGNIIEDNGGLDNIGIAVGESFDCIIKNNTISGAMYDGIKILFSYGNLISENNITNNGEGIFFIGCYGSTIFNNAISNNGGGISIESNSSENKIVSNLISNNVGGISFSYSTHDNKIYHNNFIKNSEQIYHPLKSDPLSSNKWDNGLEGNYWSDYEGQDANLDGIGDTPYIVDGDNYPLMGMFHSLNTSLGYYVNVISNSTIEGFTYFESNSTIIMHVSNMTTDQTYGFCRVRIPHVLMSEPYNVTIDGAKPHYVNYTLYDDGENRWIYFSYQHSTLEIVIIPEFPSFLILPLFMITTLLGVIVYRRKHSM